MTPVNITRIIQRTELSIPRAFASLATQTRVAMMITITVNGITTITPQAAQEPKSSADDPDCAKTDKGTVAIAPVNQSKGRSNLRPFMSARSKWKWPADSHRYAPCWCLDRVSPEPLRHRFEHSGFLRSVDGWLVSSKVLVSANSNRHNQEIDH